MRKYLCKEWTDKDGQTHTNYEYTSFSFASDCMISKDGSVALADTFNRPRSLAFSGNSLWAGEFKFGYRLLRFEMK